MTKRIFALLAATVPMVTACALPPQGVTPEQIRFYEAAVASIGCKIVHEKDSLPIELQAGLTAQQVLDITSYELAAKRAIQLPDGGVQLTTGACA